METLTLKAEARTALGTNAVQALRKTGLLRFVTGEFQHNLPMFISISKWGFN